VKKILVATDFSDTSAQALKSAVEIATACKASILLLHILHDPADAPGFYAAKKAGKKVLRNMEQAAEQMMEDFVELQLAPFEKFDTLVVPGLPAEQIVRLAKKEKVDLISIGTHGRSGLVRLMLGSVADRVIRTAPCPVLTVHQPTKFS
jgi:universal stress protein A